MIEQKQQIGDFFVLKWSIFASRSQMLITHQSHVIQI